jgi:hypothetical protein
MESILKRPTVMDCDESLGASGAKHKAIIGCDECGSHGVFNVAIGLVPGIVMNGWSMFSWCR